MEIVKQVREVEEQLLKFKEIVNPKMFLMRQTLLKADDEQRKQLLVNDDNCVSIDQSLTYTMDALKTILIGLEDIRKVVRSSEPFMPQVEE